MSQMAVEALQAAARRAGEGVSAGIAEVDESIGELRHDDDGQPYLLVIVRLHPPTAGKETWPVDDVYAVRQAVRARLEEDGVDVPVSISLASSGPEPEDGDSSSDDQLARALRQTSH